MKAMQRINTVTFLVGFLGFLTMWIFELVTLAFPFGRPVKIFKIASTTLSALCPHYNLARCGFPSQQCLWFPTPEECDSRGHPTFC